ncbi:MAG: tetratricopeptide repeat protein, partial [Planctomycetota bacterium]
RAGHYFEEAGDLAGAEKAYRKAVELGPKNPFGHNNLGYILLCQGRLEQAEAHLLEALKYRPKFAIAQTNLGLVLQKEGRIAEAIRHFQKALEIDSSSAAARNYLGRCLLARGDVEGAIEKWRELLAMHPDHLPARLALGDALAKQGEFKQAIEHLDKALEVRPGDAWALNALAWHLATCPVESLRDGTRAIELADSACRATRHEEAYILDTLAAAYAEAGRFGEAVSTAKKALRLAEATGLSVAETIQRHLECYQAGKPWRQQQPAQR